ncbi:EamA family transporter [Rossellomorea vietnamensis]|uniref:EamA family transporter n=1 Tax=Rossellomorea vietnamensis TaxID=218284 RepID=A0A5D4MD39_9BACI|nr:EamA family transporter [Rossellomorea vietnamensis]TYR98945.1 EamA family transporter [Rossellomorea vietnamensis]
MNNIFLLLTMTLLGSLGGFFFKKASGVSKRGVIKVLLFLAIGGSLYLAGAILNILLLKELPYTVVFPLTSVTYIWTLVLSYKFLDEKITIRKVTGILIIGLGCLLLAI